MRSLLLISLLSSSLLAAPVVFTQEQASGPGFYVPDAHYLPHNHGSHRTNAVLQQADGSYRTLGQGVDAENGSGHSRQLSDGNNQSSGYQVQETQFFAAVDQLTAQLIASAFTVNPRAPVGVATPVAIDNFAQADRLGLLLQEHLMTSIQRQGLPVVDFKTTGGLQVMPYADLAMSRDVDDLERRLPMEYVVTGTMMTTSHGVIVNLRMVSLQSKVMVASANGFIRGALVKRLLNIVPMRSSSTVRLSG